MIKKYISILITTIVLLLLTGCGYSEEEKAQMKSYEKVGKENAVAYIENKYGFTPEITATKVVKVDPGPVPDFFPAATGMVEVSMRYQETDFVVSISGEGQTQEVVNQGSDNYQKGEIEKAFEEWLSKELGITIASIDLQYKDNCMLTERFEDVESFFADTDDRNVVSVSVKTYDDISENTVATITSDAMELLVISCRDENSFQALSECEYINKHAYKYNFSNMDAMDRKLAEYSIFMKGHVFRNMKGEVDCKLFSAKKAGDGVFLVYDQSAGGGGVNIAKTSDMAPEFEWSKAGGRDTNFPKFENPERVGDAYAIEFGDTTGLQVYIKQGEEKENNPAIAMQYIDEDGNEVITHEYPTDVKGYYSINLDRHENMRIAVMINKK